MLPIATANSKEYDITVKIGALISILYNTVKARGIVTVYLTLCKLRKLNTIAYSQKEITRRISTKFAELRMNTLTTT